VRSLAHVFACASLGSIPYRSVANFSPPPFPPSSFVRSLAPSHPSFRSRRALAHVRSLDDTTWLALRRRCRRRSSSASLRRASSSVRLRFARLPCLTLNPLKLTGRFNCHGSLSRCFPRVCMDDHRAITARLLHPRAGVREHRCKCRACESFNGLNVEFRYAPSLSSLQSSSLGDSSLGDYSTTLSRVPGISRERDGARVSKREDLFVENKPRG